MNFHFWWYYIVTQTEPRLILFRGWPFTALERLVLPLQRNTLPFHQDLQLFLLIEVFLCISYCIGMIKRKQGFSWDRKIMSTEIIMFLRCIQCVLRVFIFLTQLNMSSGRLFLMKTIHTGQPIRYPVQRLIF